MLLIVLVYYFFTENERKIEVIKIEAKDKKSDSIFTAKHIDKGYLFPKPNTNQVVHHTKYSFSYSENDEQAEWVAYKLFKNSINTSIKRKSNFREDFKVITGSSTIQDYKNSGYDRGHLAPAKSMSFNDLTMSESFLMSNMSPQKPSFNRGVWKKLEEEVRGLLSISDSLYVVTGPVLKHPIGKIGENQVTIPRYYYKTIIRFTSKKLFGIAFLMKNEKSHKSLTSFTVSIDSIEKFTGLDFFNKLEIQTQNYIERNSNYRLFLQK